MVRSDLPLRRKHPHGRSRLAPMLMVLLMSDRRAIVGQVERSHPSACVGHNLRPVAVGAEGAGHERASGSRRRRWSGCTHRPVGLGQVAAARMVVTACALKPPSWLARWVRGWAGVEAAPSCRPHFVPVGRCCSTCPPGGRTPRAWGCRCRSGGTGCTSTGRMGLRDGCQSPRVQRA